MDHFVSACDVEMSSDPEVIVIEDNNGFKENQNDALRNRGKKKDRVSSERENKASDKGEVLQVDESMDFSMNKDETIVIHGLRPIAGNAKVTEHQCAAGSDRAPGVRPPLDVSMELSVSMIDSPLHMSTPTEGSGPKLDAAKAFKKRLSRSKSGSDSSPHLTSTRKSLSRGKKISPLATNNKKPLPKSKISPLAEGLKIKSVRKQNLSSTKTSFVSQSAGKHGNVQNDLQPGPSAISKHSVIQDVTKATVTNIQTQSRTHFRICCVTVIQIRTVVEIKIIWRNVPKNQCQNLSLGKLCQIMQNERKVMKVLKQ